MPKVMEPEMAVSPRGPVPLKTGWETTKPIPEEAQLKKHFEDEVKLMEKDLAEVKVRNEQKKKDYEPLHRSSGLDKRELNAMLTADGKRARATLERAKTAIMKPAFDIEEMHKKDLASAKEHEANLKLQKGVVSQGYIWSCSSGGFWWDRYGQTEENPSVTFAIASDRFDPRAQAYGEGWWEEDYSRINAYLVFGFTPTTWGQLDVWVTPWVHGYYQLHADDKWYKGEYCRANLYTWTQVHQNYWRSQNFNLRWSMGGAHVNTNGRIDTSYPERTATTFVGAGDPVTIRVGVQLYCRGEANGGRAVLNLQEGNANYVLVPYVHWHLTH